MTESPIRYFPVDDALVKHGISKIIISGTICTIQRSGSNDKDIIFDIGKTFEKTLANFTKSARTLKLDDNLRAAIKLHFIIECHEKKDEETKKKERIQLRRLEEDETILDKEGEAEKKEKIRRANLQYEEVTVSQCVRMHRGAVKVVGGMISGTAPLEKVISGIIVTCNNEKCNARFEVLDMPRPRWRHEWANYFVHRIGKCRACRKASLDLMEGDEKLVNAARSEIQEIESTEGLERLNVVLLDDCTKRIFAAAGQPVIIYGEIFILNIKRKETTFVFVYNIDYLQEQESLELNNSDIKEFEGWGRTDNGNNLIDKLVEMFAISVFGNEEIKKGILFSAANSGEDSVHLKRRLNTALIGETGLAKSRLLSAACELIPKSKFCSAPTSSVKSWIAIVDKDSDLGTTIRYGNIVLSSGAICAIDEIGRMPFEDQGLLLNAYQEGRIPFAKHGFSMHLPGSATFIVSSNPSNPQGVWGDENIVQLSEIPLLGPLRDRNDLIFIMRGNRKEDYLEDFALKKLAQVDDSDNTRKQEQENHKKLGKYLIFTKAFTPKLSEEAKMMFAEFYSKIGKKGSPRMVETLYNVGFAIARLKQKNVIDAEDAKETMEFYNKQLKYWEQVEEIPSDPRSFMVQEIIKKLENHVIHFDFIELAKAVCKDSKIAASYIGKDFKVESNWKLRSIRDMFVNTSYPNVMVVNMSPLELAWAPTFMWNPHKNQNKDKNETSVASVTSETSANDSNKVLKESDVADVTEVNKNSQDESDYEKYQRETRERFDRELNRQEDNNNNDS
jgi:DNA replicative helicase MCM subunit Mcm2 (Cdc46/Mcm family)